MFKQKNAVISVAVALLLAACGGGGSNNDSGGGTPPPVTGGEQPPPPVTQTPDAKLAGTATLANDFVLFERDEASFPIFYQDFTTTTARLDNPATPDVDEATGYGAYGFAKGTAAPLESFGYRLSFAPTTEGAALSEPGRLAFELRDQATAENGEVLQIEIDKITTSVDAAGNLTLVVAEGAMLYVHVTNSAGEKATVSTAATDALIRQLPVEGNTAATDFLFDVDAAVASAIAAATGPAVAVLESAVSFSGGRELPMEMALTISNLDLVLGSDQTTVLAGKTITVEGSGLAAVSGAGAQGFLQVEPESAPVP